jgi:serine/alanine adding enzyme
LWQEVYSKRRNEIRRAIKEGTTFRPDDSAESLSACYGILKKVYARARHPLPAKDYFLNLHRHLEARGQIRIFTARHSGKIVGCMICIAYEKTLYDLYAGSYPEYYSVYPNDLIPWEVFKWGRENGYTRFDFGGAGKPGIPYGVRDYKKKFGGEMINTGRLEARHRPLLYTFASTALKTYKRLHIH